MRRAIIASRSIHFPKRGQYAGWDRTVFTGERSGGFFFEPNPLAEKSPKEVLESFDVRTHITEELMEARLSLEKKDFFGNIIWKDDHDDMFSQKKKDDGIVDESALRGVFLPKIRASKIDEQGRAFGYGGRKSSSAQVWITESEVLDEGKIEVNKRDLVDYFSSFEHRERALGPLLIAEVLGNFNVKAIVQGGGLTGQADAFRMGLARALQSWDPDYRYVLKNAGMLERDERIVERKKPGQLKARRKFQWVKR